MKITNIKNFLYLLFPVLILAASCQKGIDPTDPDPIPDAVKDSTLLIKSIGLTLYDLNTGLAEDSIIEYYSYDSTNRKVILTWDNVSGEFLAGSSAELNYNLKGLLSHISYKYPDGYVPDQEDIASLELEYDADKVLQKITSKFYNGNSKSIIFNKIILSPDKYQLSWIEPILPVDDSAKAKAVFGADGKLIISSIDYSYGNGNWNTQIISTDSLIYDANGSVSKVVLNKIDTAAKTNETKTFCEFITRESKGDQLYNQHQALLNGIANIPFGEDLFAQHHIGGILSFFLGGLEPMEYSKFPFKTAKVYNGLRNEYDEAVGTSEFDNKSRLVKLRGFFRDADLIPYEWKITYYK